MSYTKLSADPLALILGILALVLGIAGCCCYGVTALIPLVLGIIGLVLANKSLRDYQQNPEAFNVQSKNNVNTAKVINIIAIVLNSIIFIVALVVFAIYGTLISSAVLSGIREVNETNENYYDDKIEVDSLQTWEDDAYMMEKEMDSVNIDSLLKTIN